MRRAPRASCIHQWVHSLIQSSVRPFNHEVVRFVRSFNHPVIIPVIQSFNQSVKPSFYIHSFDGLVKGSRHCSPCKPFVVSERGWTTWRNSWRLFSRQCWDERQRRVTPLGEGALPILLSLWVMQVWLCAKRPCTGPWPLLQATTRPTTKRPCTVSVQHGTDHKTNRNHVKTYPCKPKPC